jgi:hypothetical protein
MDNILRYPTSSISVISGHRRGLSPRSHVQNQTRQRRTKYPAPPRASAGGVLWHQNPGDDCSNRLSYKQFCFIGSCYLTTSLAEIVGIAGSWHAKSQHF